MPDLIILFSVYFVKSFIIPIRNPKSMVGQNILSVISSRDDGVSRWLWHGVVEDVRTKINQR